MQRKYKKMPANILSIMQTNKNRQSSCLALPLSLSLFLALCRCSCLSLHNKFVKACGKRKGRKGGRMIIILRIRPGSHINTHSLSAPHTHTCMHISTVCVCGINCAQVVFHFASNLHIFNYCFEKASCRTLSAYTHR